MSLIVEAIFQIQNNLISLKANDPKEIEKIVKSMIPEVELSVGAALFKQIQQAVIPHL